MKPIILKIQLILLLTLVGHTLKAQSPDTDTSRINKIASFFSVDFQQAKRIGAALSYGSDSLKLVMNDKRMRVPEKQFLIKHLLEERLTQENSNISSTQMNLMKEHQSAFLSKDEADLERLKRYQEEKINAIKHTRVLNRVDTLKK